MTSERFRQIEELYYAARDRSPEERAALLKGADAELRREVESLLSQPSRDNLLDRPAIRVAAPLIEDPTVMAPTAGSSLGPYRIESKLGEGGMGEVYRALDTRLDRAVAIKIGHRQFSARFEREARAISSLNHPNICTLYDVGPNYLVMELLEGETLAERLKSGPLSLEMVLLYGAQIAAALVEAHEKGMVHRDLKPGNIMLTKNGAKVLDFGLAKSEEDDALTGSRMAIGTPAYMAPEQARGETLDARADLFALGAVLYEMAAGRRAFAGHTTVETLDAILYRPLPPVRTLNPLLPPRLEEIIHKCLERDRKLRYQSAADLCGDLQRLNRDHESGRTSAIATPAAGRRQKESKAIDSLAVLPFTNSSADPEMEYLSEGIADSLANSFSEIRRLRVAPRSLAFRYRGKEVDPQAAGRELGVRAVLSGRVLLRRDILLVGAELLDIAKISQIWGAQYRRKFEDILAVQEEIAGEISGKLRVQLSGEEKKRFNKRPAQDQETYQLYLKALYFINRWSSDNLKRAAEYARQAVDRDPLCAPAYAVLATAYSTLGFYGLLPANEAYPKAKAAADKALELDDRLPEARTALALKHIFYDWDWAGAERECRRALELNCDYPLGREVYSHYLLSQGRCREALDQQKMALALDPLSPAANGFLGLTYFCLHDYEAGSDQLRKALELDPNLISTRAQLLISCTLLGKFEEAIAAYNLLIKTGVPVRPLLGYIYVKAGREEEARQILAETGDACEKNPLGFFYQAVLYTALGEFDRAFECLNKLCDVRVGPLFCIKALPMFEALHSDPRFGSLLRRIGLPE